ncbi:MAG TPA: hypothetical protein VLA72_02430 [Anaerolineales bacterium]|nr:hypothetical protein [Anaerolineales bacterium]
MNNISLVEFPEMFEPIVIVTGDRRESVPKTKGDLLAYSISNIDFSYLPYLGLTNSKIVTDKLFVLHSDKELKELFGNTNILAIGSPAVNFLSRKINSQNLFYFDIPDTAISDLLEHEKIIDNIRFDSEKLFIYKEIFERGLTPEEIVKEDFADYPEHEDLATKCKQIYDEFTNLKLNNKNWKQFIHNFDRTGIFDPIDGTRHAVTTKSYNDFGIISIAENPYSGGNYFIVTIAGIHGIATALGVKLLANKDAFSERPFGGIYETLFPEYGSWSDKIDKAQIKWQTKSYSNKYTSFKSVLSLIKERTLNNDGFGFFVSSPYNEDDAYFKELNQSIKTICDEHFSSTETAYSIITSGEGQFPNVIKNRIKKSVAIIHILNDFKPGVLYEIGLSIGHNKHAYIVWDNKLGKFDFTKLPKTINKITTLQFDSANEKEFHKIFSEKVIQPSLQRLIHNSINDSTFLEAALSEIQKKHDEKRVYLYISSTLDIHRNLIHKTLNDFQLDSYDETELLGKDYINTQGYGMSNASRSIFILDKKDNNGIILLGLASALQENILLLRHENISMWNGEYGKIKESTIEQDIQTELRQFLRKDYNQNS